MQASLRALLASWSAAYGAYSQYRVEFLLYMVSGVPPLIMMFGWISVNDAQQGATTKSSEWFAAYFFVVFATRQLNPIWLIREMDEQVRLGRLSPHLLFPVSFYWRLIGWHLADNTIRLPVAIVVSVAGLVLTSSYGEISFDLIPLFVLTVVFGMILNFHLELAVGCLAFWSDQTLALEELYVTCLYLLAGMTVPISLFPEAFGAVLHYLPWPYIFGFPAEMVTGTYDSGEMIEGLLIQVAWIAIAAGAARLLWMFGIRRFSAVGA